MKKAAINITTKPFKWLFNFLKNHWKMLLFVVIIIALFMFWQMKSKQAKEPKLTFTKPARETLIKTLEVSGVVDAKERANLRFIAGGKVVYIGAKEGEFVKKRQTLATIDRATLQKQLQQDLNLYMKERWDWDQTLDDTKDRALPKKEERSVDKSQWDLENTVLNVEIQDIAIKNTVLSSPIAGLLTHAPTMVPGVQLMATDYFEVVNPNTLIFKATVDESDISLVKPGLQAEINLDAYPEEQLPTHVNYIAYTSSQTSTGTVFLVEFPMTDPMLERFKIGMNGDVSIVIDTKPDVMAIPLTATRQRDKKTYVDIRTGEKTYTEKEITTGLETDEKVEVISGLTENDEILLPE
jgi:RND family efflux transporter MFP subunit